MKEISLKRVEHLVVKQNEHIELFNAGSKKQIAGWLAEELCELTEVLEKDYEDVELISEIGDMAYLLIRLSQMCGVDIIEAVLAKVQRNYKKYSGKTDRQEARKEWNGKDKECICEWLKVFRDKQNKT